MAQDAGQAGELIEQLAAIEHDRWAAWQGWVHRVCGERVEGGAILIPAELVERWERQIGTDYCDLSEQEKESDRGQVRRYWPLIESIISERDALAAQVEALMAERDALRRAFEQRVVILRRTDSGALDYAYCAVCKAQPVRLYPFPHRNDCPLATTPAPADAGQEG